MDLIRRPTIGYDDGLTITKDKVYKICENLRSVAQELENAEKKSIVIPSQIGSLFEIDGHKVCLCIVGHSRMAAAEISKRLLSALSRRQREILMELVKGHSAKIIAERLRIHPRTVEAHIHRIYQKTDTHGIAQLMEIFFAQL